jgi:alpha-beta hydrolase superfamily lysophospholipase
MRRSLPTPDPPAEIAKVDGLAYSLWLPEGEPWAGVIVLAGAGSHKESHHDFARAVREAGAAAICMDARGHGDSDGAMDARVLEDIATVAGVLPSGVPRVLRGSSMGGALAILAAAQGGYAAVVAICPATADGLARGLKAGRFDFRADVPALEAFLIEHDVATAAEQLRVPLLLLHAEGDEVVPVAHSRLLAERAPDARLIATPGGHHRSIQHDAELQGETLRWLRRRLGA